MKFIRTLFLVGLISTLSAVGVLAQGVGSVSGQVQDTLGAVVGGATVTAVAADGKQKQSISNARGEFIITGLAPGKYTVKAIAPKFALYENTDVDVTVGEKTELVVALTVAGVQENVEINNANQVSTDPDANKDATVINGKDLDALPDDPDELQAALQALAGASAGPNGGQIYIDGFTGGQLPPKESIREIRINQNPFSAEYDRPGSGRIEILTKPGTDKFRGGANFAFNDESLNSRNPFAANRAPTQLKRYGGNFSGPIQKGKSSFFVDVNENDQDNNAIVNAQILDPTFVVTSFRQDFRIPTKRFNFSPRLDLQLGSKNTLVARYSFSRSSQKNQGVGDTSLPSRAYASDSHEHEGRFTETMIINPKTVNETRLEISSSRRDQNGENSLPIVNVSSAFSAGGASIGHSFNDTKVFDLTNFTSTSFGKGMQHSFKFGGRLRHISITDRSESNYAGSFSFSGLQEIRSPVGCDPVLPPGCVITQPAIAPIDQYRGRVLGLAGMQYNPTSFSITTGNPQIGVKQTEASLFVSDDWKLRPDFLLSVGLRYENQTNISSDFNFAPRLGIAWSPGATGAKGPKFVLRVGAGIFYDRFSENNTLRALRLNGSNQLNLVVNGLDSDPVRRAAAQVLLSQPVFTLNGVTNVPTAAQILAALPQSNSTVQVSPVLETPYSMLTVVSVEKALSPKFTISTNFQFQRTLHSITQRNVNAPICPGGQDLTVSCVNGVRPQPTLGNITEYDSNGVQTTERVGVFLRANLSPKISLFGTYSLGFLKSNADTPVYQYDLTGEYVRAFTPRHVVGVFGNITLPWAISLNPNINFRTGTPFNITLGQDLNGDGYATERPTFGKLAAACTKFNVTYQSFCDVTGFDPNAIIPKNFGDAPSSFTVGLRVGKTFTFGAAPDTGNSGRNGGGGGIRGGAGGGGNRGGGGAVVMAGGPGGGGPMGGFGGGGAARGRYSLNLGIQVTNLFNTVNLGTPVGNILSSRFGQSVSTGGSFGGFGGFGGGTGPNRRVELQMRFNF